MTSVLSSQYNSKSVVSPSIKSGKLLVTDSSLTSGVDYGFAYWAHGSSGFSRWNGNHKTGTGSATPCNSYNCLKVPVYKGGAAQIAKMIKTVNT